MKRVEVERREGSQPITYICAIDRKIVDLLIERENIISATFAANDYQTTVEVVDQCCKASAKMARDRSRVCRHPGLVMGVFRQIFNSSKRLCDRLNKEN